MREIHIGRIERRLVGVNCPHCGRIADGGTCVDDKEASPKPKPGDYALCLYCGSLNTYTAALTLRKVERAERRKIQRDPRLAGLLELMEEVAAARRQQWQ